MTEPYQVVIANEFETRNILRRYRPMTNADRDVMASPTAPNGELFKEIFLTQQTTFDEAAHNLGICLDSFLDTWKMNRGGTISAPIVYWRIMPEVCKSEARPYLWRAYTRLALG